MQNVFVFLPAFGQTILATTWMTTHALQAHLSSRGIGGGFSTLSFPDIAELRAMALTIWYDTMPNVKYLLFVDADMGFPPEMVTDMMLLDEGIVGTIYRQRREPASWAGSGTGSPTTERRGNFMLVEGVGMGCTLIRRDVVTAMLEKMPEMVDTRLALHPARETLQAAGCTRLIRAFEKLDIKERGIVSEDLSFCIRAKECGFPTWAAIGYNIHHVGLYDYNGRYLDMVEAQQAQMAQQAAQAAQAVPQQAVPQQVVIPGVSADELAKIAGPDPIIRAAPEPMPEVPEENKGQFAPDVLSGLKSALSPDAAGVALAVATVEAAKRKTSAKKRRAVNGRAGRQRHAHRMSA